MSILNKDGTIPTWWAKGPLPGNFGDILTPLLIDKLFGYKCVWTHKPFKEHTLIAIGSILNKCENGTVVWGSGAMRAVDPIKMDAVYLSVRGPHTRDLVCQKGIKCPDIFGDPALIMPEVYKPTVKNTFSYGLIPHYVDYDMVLKWYANDPDVVVINVLNKNPLMVIEQMAKCNRIISSSLHGVIIGHAYGIPTAWAKHSGNLSGDGIKFADHFSSIKLTLEHHDFYVKLPVSDLEKFNYQTPETVNTKRIIKAFDSYIH